MERSGLVSPKLDEGGSGLNWQSQAPKPSDVSLKAAFGDSSSVLTLHVSNRDTIHPFMQNASSLTNVHERFWITYRFSGHRLPDYWLVGG